MAFSFPGGQTPVMSRTTAPAAAALAALAFGAALTACTGPALTPWSLADDSYPGLAQTADPTGGSAFDTSPRAEWLEGGRSISITTWGSSSCPPVPTALEATAPDAVTVHFEPSPFDPCTADMAPTTHELSLPVEVDARPLTITLEHGSTDATTSLVLD